MLYFKLLDQAFADPEKLKYLNKEKINEFRDFGGVNSNFNELINFI